MIVTAFRGTEPRKIKDWLSDASTPPWPGPGGTGFIHYGFGAALQSIYPPVREAITEFRDNDQTIWFTGHSLGGALAARTGSSTTTTSSPRCRPHRRSSTPMRCTTSIATAGSATPCRCSAGWPTGPRGSRRTRSPRRATAVRDHLMNRYLEALRNNAG
ncbi:lipase family protein [Actinokineospora fastidiosa]|nr:hypothetical protein [Actinokineospora fastidiosa]